MNHDFWREQPVKDADVFYFRWVFHDCSDSHAVRILRLLIPALKKGTRIFIDDICVPPGGRSFAIQGALARVLFMPSSSDNAMCANVN